MRITAIVTFAIATATAALAQQGYQLDFEVKGLRDTTVYLGYYSGESTYLKDTAQVSGSGKFSFDGADALGHGVYFLVLNRTRLFEFSVGEDQQFSMAADTADYVGTLVVKGDKGNEAFVKNISH